MGGSGGGGFFSPRDPDELRADVERALENKAEREIDLVLAEQLAKINDRDQPLVEERLDAIASALDEVLDEFDRLRFGGSVAKHTYVDGISDIDSLVVIDSASADIGTPTELRRLVARALKKHLDHSSLAERAISVGKLAVTVRYADGMEVQLLPALKRSDGIAISAKDGRTWSFIRPKTFANTLTEANRSLGGRLVPTIKLAKALIDSIPRRDRPGGYHVEALAVDAFRQYDGPHDRRSLVLHLLRHAGRRILRPIADVTGQSSRIDERLGPPRSADRQRVSRALGRLARRAEQASDADTWRDLLEE